MTLPSLAVTVQGYSTKLPAAQDLPAADRHKPLSLSAGTSPCWDAASRRVRVRVLVRVCCNCALAWQVWINERYVSRGGDADVEEWGGRWRWLSVEDCSPGACVACICASAHTITTLSCDDDLIKAGHGGKKNPPKQRSPRGLSCVSRRSRITLDSLSSEALSHQEGRGRARGCLMEFLRKSVKSHDHIVLFSQRTFYTRLLIVRRHALSGLFIWVHHSFIHFLY